MFIVHLFLLLFISSIVVSNAQGLSEQEIQKITDTFNAANNAFNNGKYREAIGYAQQVEKISPKKNTPNIAHIIIVSYYRLGEYQNCINASKAFLATSPANNNTVAEIKAAVADSQKKLDAQKAEKARLEEIAQKKAAHEKAAADEWARIKDSENVQAIQAWLNRYSDTPLAQTVRNRLTTVQNIIAARTKTAFEKEAANEWARIRNTEDIQTVQSFLNRYGNTPSAQPARNRLTELNRLYANRTRYAELEKTYYQYKKEKKKSRRPCIIMTTLGVGALGGGYYMATTVDQKQKAKEDRSEFDLDYKIGGYITAGVGVILTSIGIVIWNKSNKYWDGRIFPVLSEMNKLLPGTKLSFEPEITPVYPLHNTVIQKDLAYGFKVTMTF